MLLLGTAAPSAAFLEPLLIETIPLAFRKKVSVHNGSDFLLQVNGQSVAPGKSVELLQDSRGGVLRWYPIRIAYRGTDPRLSGLHSIVMPTNDTKKITAAISVSPDPDTEPVVYKGSLARVFGFEIRQEK